VLPLYLVAQGAAVVIVLAIVLVCIAVGAVWEELTYQWPGRRGFGSGWVWIRATWRGEHVGKALMDYIDDAEERNHG
jgi:hypothetical protein